MFSPYVITAIEVLLRLQQEQQEGSLQQSGVDLSDLYSANAMRKPIVRKVFRQLLQVKYMTLIRPPHHYLLQTDPGEITLLQLVQLFHGGICIGEAYDHYQIFGLENFGSDSYRNYLHYETRLHDQLYRELRTTMITDFKDTFLHNKHAICQPIK